jgi:hypothetical protein
MFKKGLLVLFAVLAFSLTQMVPAMAADDANSAGSTSAYSYFKSVKLIIGETQAEVNYEPAVMEQAAYMKQGRTLVPLRFVGESLGATFNWDNNTKQVTFNLGGSKLVVTVGSKVAYVDGKMTTLDVPAELKSGRTFVPIRFVGESFGAHVNYDAETKTVDVRYSDMTGWKTFVTPKTDLQFLYPPDWTATAIEDGYIAKFTSPKGSVMVAYITSAPVSKVYADIKSENEKDGIKLDNELFDTPGSIEDGFELDFSYFDTQKNGLMCNPIYVDPMDTGSFIADMSILERDIEIDSTVMLDIAYR